MLTHGFIVLDDKHCLGAIAAGQFFDAPRELDGLLLGKKARQIDLYRRALLDLAVDLHVAARLLDEPIDPGKADPGAVPDLLRRAERAACRVPHTLRRDSWRAREG